MTRSSEPAAVLTRSQAWSLYTLHSLTAWSSRTYEFAAIIFTASLFPDNLTAASIRGVSTTIACVCFSSALGRWIDASTSRLWSLSTSIWVQQGATILSYLLWLLVVDHGAEADADSDPLTKVVFAIVLLTGIFVKFGSIANNLAIDRQWLPVIAPSSMSQESPRVQYDLTHLNAVLRRIDLICKIVTPFVFDFWVSITGSSRVVIAFLGGASLISCGIELKLAGFIYHSNNALQARTAALETSLTVQEGPQASTMRHRWQTLCTAAADQVIAVQLYFASTVWIPSLAWALLHLTVLAYSASLITHMLEVGFTLDMIAIAQSVGTGMEVASTFFTPWIIHRYSRRSTDPEIELDETGTALLAEKDRNGPPRNSSVLETVGLCGISWQFACLIPVIIGLFYTTSTSSSTAPLTAASISLLAFLSLSRAGYWAYELTTQELTQTLVPAAQLSAFAGVQQSFQSACELLHWLATAVWAAQSQFAWLGLASGGAVGVAAAGYAGWVVRRRRARGTWVVIAGGEEGEEEEEEEGGEVVQGDIHEGLGLADGSSELVR